MEQNKCVKIAFEFPNGVENEENCYEKRYVHRGPKFIMM